MNKRKRRLFGVVFTLIAVLIVLSGAGILFFIQQKEEDQTVLPDKLILKYMSCIESGRYEEMYGMLNEQSRTNMSQEDFTARNKNIYEGIGASGITIEVTGMEESGETDLAVRYETAMNTSAGEIRFDNLALYTKNEEGEYLLEWGDQLIFPQLEVTDKVRVSTDKAARGQILDRNGVMLAGPGTASSVGLVPGKMNENADQDIGKVARLLGITEENIRKKLDAGWVKEDSFVPLKTIKKLKETDLMKEFPSQEALEMKALEDELLSVPGVKITDVEVRAYPLGEAASHLTGYVQNVTAEDLEKHPGEGYRSDSVIGRSGMEALYEKELKGQDGHTIRIVNAQGSIKEVLASAEKRDGETIRLTVDAELQKAVYDQFKEDKSCSVAMNPRTGEVLALVSTPAYDSNDFILGLSNDQWNALNEDPDQPMYNRFRQKFAPGSSFKPIIAALGMEEGAIDPNEDFGSEGLSWQKDSSWGNYYVTTLHTYQPAILENALIYSDNIYFAKAALKIGSRKLEEGLERLGFNEQLPFEIIMAKSQYSNGDSIDNEIQLADSGYGQGQILVNPLHLASIYTAFVNGGSIVKPYLNYKEGAEREIWIDQAFSAATSEQVKSALIKVVNNPEGTGYAARLDTVTLAGKTGTAEIKASKDDNSGTELGWFCVFTEDPQAERPLLLVSMAEDVKDRGGSGYVLRKDKEALQAYGY
ncbi:penicillin-binding transpeptidase domain-containing protein [Clostridium sp. MCC353]|uniref:penicillin-binding transpeptidase domain-containing protein n=1 Tax=Clostridium sp. MCC353 TaxID=2592646 RepID=UPI0020796C3F|nr:penicillin-binding transpeptidase domain-containing protein [Clostridium sp. MCC353]